LLIEGSRRLVIAEVRREVAALLEVLIASGTLLTVPTLFVGDGNCCQDGEPFDSNSNVG